MNYIDVFNANVHEDQDDILQICDIASKTIKEKFLINISDPRILGTIFNVTYSCFLEKLKEFEARYSNYRIDVAGRFGIGYTTTDESEDDEKQGNFMIFFEDYGTSKKNNDPDMTATAKERVVQWNVDNIVQPDVVNAVGIMAASKLKELDIVLASSEFVMPIFIAVYDTLVNYLLIKRSELASFEYEINFISCFNIKAMESGESNDIIAIRPNIEAKLTLKNDAVASSKYE